jgi:hypothetical protein
MNHAREYIRAYDTAVARIDPRPPACARIQWRSRAVPAVNAAASGGHFSLRAARGMVRHFLGTPAAASCAMPAARLIRTHGKRTEADRAAGTDEAEAGATDAERDRRRAWS